jgi:hypothetical protein
VKYSDSGIQTSLKSIFPTLREYSLDEEYQKEIPYDKRCVRITFSLSLRVRGESTEEFFKNENNRIYFYELF